MNTLLTIYIAISFCLWGGLFVIWSTQGKFNNIVKFLNLLMSLFSLVLLLANQNYIKITLN